MGKPARLSAADVRAVAALAGECRDLGDDAFAWRTHLAAGLGRRVGAGLAVAAEVGGCVRGPRHDLGAADWGWANGFDRAGWELALTEFGYDPYSNPLVNRYAALLPRRAGACLPRTGLVDDRDWYAGSYYQRFHRVIGVDHTLTCLAAVRGADDEYTELYLSRAAGEADFTPRQAAVVREAVAAVAPLVGGPLARFADPSPAALPPRARRVLRCLLEGDSDKQVAARLWIRPHTVNQYVKVVFAHFGVSSRAELLARWVRRGWPVGGWADA